MILKPTSTIKASLGIDPNGKAQKFFTNACAKAMDKYVPFDKGNLADYYIDGTQIVYDQLYAKYQYYGVRSDGTHKINEDNRNREKHPQATSYWDKVMWANHKDQIIKDTQNYIKRG